MVELNFYEIIMQVVNFLILLYLLNRFVFSKLQSFLDQRQQEIADNLKKAEEQRLETQKIMEEQQHQLQQARRQALEIKEEAENMAKKNGEQILKEAREKSNKVLEDNKQQLIYQANKTREDLVDYLAGVSSRIVSKVLSSKADQKMMDEEIQKEIKAYKG